MGIRKALIRSFIFFSSFLLLSLTACGKPVLQTSHSNVSKQSLPSSSTQIEKPSSSSIKVEGAKQAPVKFTQVDFPDQKNGWVTGSVTSEQGKEQALLWHTTDGGDHWMRQATPFAKLSSVQLDGQGDGWAIANSACSNGQCTPDEVVYTSDGGAHWTTQWKAKAISTDGQASLQQINDQTAYAILDKQLLITTDGGKKWNVLSGFNGQPSQLSFVSEKTGWVSGESSAQHPVLYKTIDGGNHWITEKVPQLQGGTTGIQGLSFINPSKGWVLVSNIETFRGALYMTADGGRHWKYLCEVKPFRPYAKSIRFTNMNTGIIPLDTGAGPIAGGVMVTHDGGNHFDSVGMNQDWSMRDAEMVSDQQGWAVGGFDQNAYLLHTIDGGKSWTQVLPFLQPRQDIQFVDASHGFGLGISSDPNAVLATEDGGKSWNIRYTFSHNIKVRSLAFTNDHNGMAITENQQTYQINLYQTTDCGRSWVPIGEPSQPKEWAQSNPYIQLFQNDNGLVQVSESPNFIFSRTTDGGKTWSGPILKKANPPGSQYAVSFLSPKEGFLFISLKGQLEILQTSDGAKWEVLKPFGNLSGDPIQVVSAEMVTPQVGYLLSGDDQQYDLWKTTDGGKSWKERKFPKQVDFRSSNVSMYFTDAQNGWIESEAGLLQTKDGGNEWTWIK